MSTYYDSVRGMELYGFGNVQNCNRWSYFRAFTNLNSYYQMQENVAGIDEIFIAKTTFEYIMLLSRNTSSRIHFSIGFLCGRP